MKTGISAIAILFFVVIKTFAQEEENDNSIWGKLALAQNFPNPVIEGEITTINYKARDAHNVSIALYDADGKWLHTYEDLYAGSGQIRIRKRLDPGKYTYALFVNGRLVDKKTMQIINAKTSSTPEL